MRLGQIIKKWRLVLDLSTRQAGEKIGISASAVQRIENGIVPDGETIIKLMRWLFEAEPVNGSDPQ